jgi:hypothetical protein
MWGSEALEGRFRGWDTYQYPGMGVSNTRFRKFDAEASSWLLLYLVLLALVGLQQ